MLQLEGIEFKYTLETEDVKIREECVPGQPFIAFENKVSFCLVFLCGIDNPSADFEVKTS